VSVSNDADRRRACSRAPTTCSSRCAARSARNALAVARVFRSEGRRAAGASIKYQRHRVQPRAERQDEPGGLRDIQTIGWVAQAALRRATLDELVAHGFLTQANCDRLSTAAGLPVEGALRAARLTGRREDRLLFDHQIALARMFGYEDATLHARRRAVHAALLPHGHGREPAERDAAAALPRGILTDATRLRAR
jgi:UTP:GlnB (protein PII) uridylyltransferase